MELQARPLDWRAGFSWCKGEFDYSPPILYNDSILR